MTKNILIYCRVSTNEQTTENQKRKLEEYAIKQGWKFKTYEEVMSTRKTRPIKQEVLKLLRQKEYEGVLVWKLDRWARSSSELMTEIEEFINKEIEFYSFTDNLDVSTSTGKLYFGILSVFAQFERDLIRERTMEGLARAKAEGRVGGRPKGKKDSKPRKKGGYYLRHMKNDNKY